VDSVAPEAGSSSHVAESADEGPQGIEWFEGSVDEAFAYAKAHDKPVFLYWGAAWCPPCHYVKKTIFAKRAFIERSRLFVPVYLDGDTDKAQELGEKLGVLGYPTMIVYDSSGREVTRIPGGIDIGAYASVLDSALAAASPVSETVSAVLDGRARLGASSCRLVAYYSWSQDNERILAERDPVAVFSALRGACPSQASKERARLYLEELDARLEAAKNASVSLADEQKAPAVEALERILGDYALAKDNRYYVFFAAAELARAVTAPGSEARRRLTSDFLRVLNRMQGDASLYPSERLYTVIGKIQLAGLDGGSAAEVPRALRDEARRLVAWADASTSDPYERQVVMNAAWGVLTEAGLEDEAGAMLAKEIGKSSQPHYFMSGLAELARRAGHDQEAIAWLRRAYDAAEGQATRFQWGVNYVIGLLEMTPDDTDVIEQETLRLFGGLKGSAASAFYQRTTARMKRLESKLLDWNKDDRHRASLETIRAGVRKICAGIDEQEPSRANCEAFLAAA
jgi:thiol-disulfide isomerase/thioredoxin